MKTLYESLLDDEEDLVNDDSGVIETFLKDNYWIQEGYNIQDNVVYTKGNIILKNSSKIKHLTNGLFEFSVDDDCMFDCSGTQIEDLVGAPKIVHSFLCEGCENLKSLKGAPQILDRFSCRKCSNLKNLEGMSQEIKYHFSCTRCTSLTSLKGAPKKCEGDFACSYTSIKDLTGCPEIIRGDFSCHHNKKLKSLNGAPKIIEGDIDMHDNDKLAEELEVSNDGKVNKITYSI